MRQVIPFTKNIEFKTMINEITNISLEHTLELNDEYNINGDFIITGKYKVNQTSPQEESFSYKIPIDITIDQKYKTDNIDLEIDDFKYQKIDSNKLKVDIDLSIDNLEKIEKEKHEFQEERNLSKELEPEAKEEIENLELNQRKILSDSEKKEIDLIINSDDTTNLFKEISLPKEIIPVVDETQTPKELEVNIEKEEKKEMTKTSVGSLFTAFKDTEETFSTYSVYIVRNGDNIEEIISKYKTTREILEDYNDMSNIKIGSKIIIPNTKNENDK